MKKLIILLITVSFLAACAKTDSPATSYENSSLNPSDTSYSYSSSTNTNTQQTTNAHTDASDTEKNISFTESDLPVFSDDPTINHQYFESIITLETTGYLPDGEFIYDINDQYYYNYKEIAYSDKVAVYDINNDGKNELLIKIGGTGYSDNNLYVFSYNFNENFELLFRIPARETFFDNSIVKIDDYKTQYKQYYEEFYPYSCLIIDSTEITIFAHVEQLFLTDNNDIPGFPNDCDLNNNNVVYKIEYNNDYSNFEYLDDADYYEWKKEHLSKPQDIQFYPIS